MNTEWLEKCAQAGEFLYGIYPYEVLMQMYRLKESGKVRKTELRAVINGSAALMLEYIQRRLLVFYEMGYHEAGYILPYLPPDGETADFFQQAAKAGNPYAVLHVDPDEVEYLLKEQGDRPFYIPTAEEIETLRSTAQIVGSAWCSSEVPIIREMETSLLPTTAVFQEKMYARAFIFRFSRTI